MKRIFYLPMLILIFGCTKPAEDPQQIISEVIKVAGGEMLNNTEIEFDFRDKEYGALHQDGKYEYVRIFKDDSLGLVRDVLTNDSFIREIDGDVVDVADSMATKYSNSINSVIYFALLPIGLDAPAVNSQYIGTKELKGIPYHKIKVTFDQEGGGDDFEDEFIYWINQETNKVDYLAYLYHTDGGGMRFREAINERYVGGIRFVDYINYEPNGTLDLIVLDDAYLNNELKEISRIELDLIKVNPIQ